jgi:tRNA(fMet)-specific endonuclease VapC
MLDTNVVSHLMRGHPAVDRAVVAHPRSELCISAVTAGELLFGLQRRPESHWVATATERFLAQVETMPWDSHAARTYGAFRTELERRGQSLSPLDLLIAAHALALGAVLVTNDQAMLRLPNLATEDWTRDV